MFRKPVVIIFFFCSLVFSCTPDKEIDTDQLVIRLNVDPDRINPLLNPTSSSREVYQYVMLMLAEVDPVTLEWSPLLIKELPKPREVENGEYEGKWAYDFEILPDAEWSDGRPVTAQDYLFTYKVMFHKGVNVAGFKAYFSNIIVSIDVDEEAPRKIKVIVNKPGDNILFALCGVELYPRHFYDPNNALENYTLEDLRDDAKYDDFVIADPELAQFGTQFHKAKYSREVVEGAGPYKLVSWETDQFIRLVKKDNYWGKNYPDRIPLNAYPQEIIFQIVEDDVIAISQLKGGDLDMSVLQATTGERFEELRKDELLNANFDFYTPQLMKYFNIHMNNENPILADKRVRRAMAHLIDVDRLIEVVEGGNGERAVSIIPKYRSYYNSKLEPISYNPDKAIQILSEAGWTDSNGNGILDKEIDGIREEMRLRFFTTNSTLGQRVAFAMKEGASNANVEIELITQSFRVTMSQNIKTGDYEMTAISTGMSPVDEPHLSWHTTAIGGNGGNKSRFSNAQADSIMDELVEESDQAKRAELFGQIQKIIYDEQPIIMLYFPLEKILVNKKYDPLITTRRPGYLANAFRLAK